MDGQGRIDETRGGLQDGGDDIDAVVGHLVFAMNLALETEDRVRDLIFGPQGLETRYFDHLRAAVEEWNGWVRALNAELAGRGELTEAFGIWFTGEPVPLIVAHPNGETAVTTLTASGWALPDDLPERIRNKYLQLAAKDAEATWGDIEEEIEWFRHRMAERAEELSRLGHEVSAGPLGLWSGPQTSGPHAEGQILGDTSKLGGWIPTAVPEESRRVLTDIRENGVEAQGAGDQRMGPLFPQPFENSGGSGGYQLPRFDSAGREIEYTEWGTVQSADNPNWGGERIVTGSDGSAYYSPTHYQTWIVMEAGG
ncbi:hypothetical protein [Streptomyces sp. B6B3]|uniref:hypothetical protein n=1 Tax=Streptomyces sp. B6B3 TaxID=3153570 RepID=UPI00325D063C